MMTTLENCTHLWLLKIQWKHSGNRNRCKTCNFYIEFICRLPAGCFYIPLSFQDFKSLAFCNVIWLMRHFMKWSNNQLTLSNYSPSATIGSMHQLKDQIRNILSVIKINLGKFFASYSFHLSISLKCLKVGVQVFHTIEFSLKTLKCKVQQCFCAWKKIQNDNRV